MSFKKFHRIIEEGGAYGHMANVHEDYTLQFSDLHAIVQQSLDGGIRGEVKEKTDGQALAVSYRAGRVIFARNKGHYIELGKNALKSSSGVMDFFANHPNNDIKKAFSYAAKDLEKGILSLDRDQLEYVFGDGRRWINIEVIWPKTTNVIPYNHELIVLHNFREYDENGQVVGGDFDQFGKMLADMLRDVNQHVQSKFTITSMPLLTLPRVKNFAERQGEFRGQLNGLMREYELSAENTIGDYWVSYMSRYISNAARQFNYIVQGESLRQIANRWAYKSLPPSRRPSNYNSIALSKISDLKNMIDNPDFVNWVSATEKTQLKQIYDEMIYPLKLIFLKVGTEVLKNITNFLALNPKAAVQKIRQDIEEVTAEIEKTGDMDLIQKLKKELKIINDLGGKDSIVPSEGLTFTYTPENSNEQKIFKFTGTFAPVNQILGSLRFSR